MYHFGSTFCQATSTFTMFPWCLTRDIGNLRSPKWYICTVDAGRYLCKEVTQVSLTARHRRVRASVSQALKVRRMPWLGFDMGSNVIGKGVRSPLGVTEPTYCLFEKAIFCRYPHSPWEVLLGIQRCYPCRNQASRKHGEGTCRLAECGAKMVHLYSGCRAVPL
jgi:hypothetical protein